MKQLIVCMCVLLSSLGMVRAQGQVDLTIRYESTLGRYEVYAIPTFTGSSYRVGGSQITVVLPASVSNVPLSITSVGGGMWADGPQVYSPVVQAGSDFHAVATTGSGAMLLNLVSGVPTLLFTFRLPEGCVGGVRLFNNGLDPGAVASMNFGDFRNNFFGTSSVSVGEIYRSNTNNTGTSCTNCQLVAPSLSK